MIVRIIIFVMSILISSRLNFCQNSQEINKKKEFEKYLSIFTEQLNGFIFSGKNAFDDDISESQIKRFIKKDYRENFNIQYHPILKYNFNNCWFTVICKDDRDRNNPILEYSLFSYSQNGEIIDKTILGYSGDNMDGFNFEIKKDSIITTHQLRLESNFSYDNPDSRIIILESKSLFVIDASLKIRKIYSMKGKKKRMLKWNNKQKKFYIRDLSE